MWVLGLAMSYVFSTSFIEVKGASYSVGPYLSKFRGR